MFDSQERRHLSLFGLTASIYVLFRRPDTEPSLAACLIKVAPVLAAAFFVWRQGVRIPSRHDYSKYIFVGLLFSAVGDLGLQLEAKGYFLVGVAAFGVAHMFFIRAFGIKPTHFLLLLPIGLYGIAYYSYLSQQPRVTNDPPFAVALPIYCVLICTMFWRALTRWRVQATAKNFDARRHLWSLVGFIGAASFVISDTSLAWWIIFGTYTNVWEIVMSSYYMAQILISLSILQVEADVDTTKRQNHNAGEIKSR